MTTGSSQSPILSLVRQTNRQKWLVQVEAPFFMAVSHKLSSDKLKGCQFAELEEAFAQFASDLEKES